jgi:hypothetical protein
MSATLAETHPNPLDDLCKCGHPRRNHRAVSGSCKVFVVRNGDSCGCAEFRPKKVRRDG